MHGILREEFAQATVEYAIVTVALLSIVLAIVGLWRAGTDGRLAALVEQAASHGVASTSVIDALRALATSRCIDIAREDRAQSTVEVAFCCRRF